MFVVFSCVFVAFPCGVPGLEWCLVVLITEFCLLLYFELLSICIMFFGATKIVSEYDQEIPQSQTADKPMAPRGKATQQSRDTMKTY